MKIKEISIAKRITINLGNYQSLQIEASATLECGDDVSIAMGGASDLVNAQIKKEAAKSSVNNLTAFGIK